MEKCAKRVFAYSILREIYVVLIAYFEWIIKFKTYFKVFSEPKNKQTDSQIYYMYITTSMCTSSHNNTFNHGHLKITKYF